VGCVGRAVQIADLAAQLACNHAQAEPERAFLLGLLSDSQDSLQRAAGGPVSAEDILPDWLVRPDARYQQAGAAVTHARRLVHDESAQTVEGIDLRGSRRRAAVARRRWFTPVGGAADWLPQLAEKLQRLAALEGRFQELLQTEKLESMAEFAAGAGHEINNPLTVIAGRAQLFLREETDPERRRAMAMINAQAMRVYEMIADLRLFSRPPPIEPQPVELVALVDRLVAEMAPSAAEQRTELRRTGPSEPVEIDADPTQLLVALRALCDNALEAIGTQGHVELQVRAVPQGAEIRTADDGPGIAPEHRRHLFDPFYSGWQAGRGLGLGLSKCWRIVTNHGGRIHVDSEPGGGAVFTMFLPSRR